MKPALQSLGCGTGTTFQSKCLLDGWQLLKRAIYSRRVKAEMDSYFRITEAMGLNPNGPVPPFLAAKVLRAQSLITSLTGITFPLPATKQQRQP